MRYASDFRGIARQALRNHWGVAIGTGFVAGLFGVSGTIISNIEWRKYKDVLDFQYRYLLLLVFIAFISIALVWFLICLFLGGPIKLGYARFNKKLIGGYEVSFSDLFSRFDMFWKGFGMQFLMGLYTFLWSLLFIIPGIIAAFSYAMTPYILEENPQMTVNEAIFYSKEMMRGNKWRLFCLYFSFIGWSLLCTLSLGIGYLWLGPYVSAAEAAFFYDVSGKFPNPTYHQYDQNRPNPTYQQYGQNPNTMF